MKKRITWLALSLMVMILLSGCKGGGGGVSGLFGGASDAVAGILGGGGSDSGDSILGGGTVIASAGYDNPEPATMALMGGGLAVFGWLKRRKKK